MRYGIGNVTGAQWYGIRLIAIASAPTYRDRALPEQQYGNPRLRHPFASALSGLSARKDARHRAGLWPKMAAREGGRLSGMLVCMVIGHQVGWGPCPRCDRRAP